MRSYWCGNSYRIGALLVASIDMSYALIHVATGLLVIFIPQLFLNESTERSFIFPPHYLPESGSLEKSVTLAIAATICAFAAECALATLLFCAIIQRDPIKCDIWVKIRLILLVIGTFGYSLEMSVMRFENYSQVFTLTVILLVAVLYRIYSIRIVRSFYSDLLFILNGYDLGLRLFTSPNKI